MDLVIKIVFGAVLIVFVVWLFQPRRVFVVRVKDGRASVLKGRVSALFVEDVGEACREFGVDEAEVYGNQRGKQIVLSFSWGVPPQCRQRLRNLWHLGPAR